MAHFICGDRSIKEDIQIRPGKSQISLFSPLSFLLVLDIPFLPLFRDFNQFSLRSTSMKRKLPLNGTRTEATQVRAIHEEESSLVSIQDEKPSDRQQVSYFSSVK